MKIYNSSFFILVFCLALTVHFSFANEDEKQTAQYHLDKAHKLNDLGKLEDAHQEYLKSLKFLKSKKDKVGAYGSLCVTFFKKEDYENSEICCRNVLSAAPKSKWAQKMMKKIKDKRFDQKSNPEIYFNKGDQLNDLGKFEEAHQEYLKSLKFLKSKKDKIRAFGSISTTFFKKGDYENSEIYCKKVLLIAPNNKWAQEMMDNLKNGNHNQELASKPSDNNKTINRTKSTYLVPNSYQILNNYECATLYDNATNNRSDRYFCFVVKDNPKQTGVITLKNISGCGDWDILVGKQFDSVSKKMHGVIHYKNNIGTIGELLWLPVNSYDDYVVVAYPTTSIPSSACLIFHRVDTENIANQAFFLATTQCFLEWIVKGDNDSQAQSNMNSRLIAGGLSIVNRNNLAGVGYDMTLNEISVQLSNAFGGGSFLFTFGMNYFGAYLENSGQFLFGQSAACEN